MRSTGVHQSQRCLDYAQLPQILLEYLPDCPKTLQLGDRILLNDEAKGEIVHHTAQFPLDLYLAAIVPPDISQPSLLTQFVHPDRLLQLVAEVETIVEGLQML